MIEQLILIINGVVVLFYSVLWVLGTLDRKRTLHLLYKVLEAIEGCNGIEYKKGGEKTREGGETL